MAQPAYRRVYTAIRKQITDKEYDVGTILPPEYELEREFGVSRTTVRRAIALLVQEGLLSVRQGFGTQVISRKAVHNLNRFMSISDSLQQKGRVIGLQSCYIEKVSASKEIAQLLGMAPQTPVWCIHRIKTADGVPICLIRNYIPVALLPQLDPKTPLPHLYDYLREQGIVYSGSRDIISASSATFEQAQLLGIEPRAALFGVQRVCYRDGRPAEVDIVHIVADMYEYEVFMGKEQ